MPIWAQSCLTLWNPMDYKPPGSSAMAFSRQEYWSGLLFSSPGNLPNPGFKLESLESPALAGGFFITAPLGKRLILVFHTPVHWCTPQLFAL